MHVIVSIYISHGKAITSLYMWLTFFLWLQCFFCKWKTVKSIFSVVFFTSPKLLTSAFSIPLALDTYNEKKKKKIRHYTTTDKCSIYLYKLGTSLKVVSIISIAITEMSIIFELFQENYWDTLKNSMLIIWLK